MNDEQNITPSPHSGTQPYIASSSRSPVATLIPILSLSLSLSLNLDMKLDFVRIQTDLRQQEAAVDEMTRRNERKE
jgi:hypothetical protein